MHTTLKGPAKPMPNCFPRNLYIEGMIQWLCVG